MIVAAAGVKLRTSSIIVASLLAAGCGDGDERCVGSVLVRATDPTLIAYRQGGTDWTTPEQVSDGIYELCIVEDDYEYVRGCLNSSGFSLAHVATTRSEPLELEDVRCGLGAISLSGTVSGPATVWLDGTGFGRSVFDWPFTFYMPAGRYDLVVSTDEWATGQDPGKVIVRRDISVDATTMVGRIDLALEGTALRAQEFLVSGVDAQDLVSTSVYLETTNGGQPARISSGMGPTMHVLDASALEGDDRQTYELSAQYDRRLRQVLAAELPGDPLALPAALDDTVVISANRLTASWATLPESYASVSILGSDATSVRMKSMSRNWIAAHGITEISLENDGLPDGFTRQLEPSSTRSAFSVRGQARGVVSTTALFSDP